MEYPPVPWFGSTLVFNPVTKLPAGHNVTFLELPSSQPLPGNMAAATPFGNAGGPSIRQQLSQAWPQGPAGLKSKGARFRALTVDSVAAETGNFQAL
jgi:hypothetical protein